jgi:hypothetical protein
VGAAVAQETQVQVELVGLAAVVMEHQQAFKQRQGQQTQAVVVVVLDLRPQLLLQAVQAALA